jgi:cytochrome c oxidase accessory protein FixG
MNSTETHREAAPGILQTDVTAVNTKEKRSLFAGRQYVYPKRVSGKFRTIKWIVMIVALGVYYGLPWIRWHRAEGLPDQAFLLDFAHQRMYLFGVELWAQELYYITGILVLSALGLFMVTAMAGRVWCGYACPQTVWTDLMVAVERFWQGDRNSRIRLSKSKWGFEKIWKYTATHLSWLLIGVLTGGAAVFYFRDAPTLAHEFITGSAPMVAYIFVGIFGLATYVLGGISREQVCIYMCPWPRIQGAMFDAESLLVTYRGFRGEPRGPHRKGESWEGRGDCIDCKQCIAACPMGIDIRNGPQLECIQCALCIDACDSIMKQIGRPTKLVAYDSYRNLEAESHGELTKIRFIRPRTMVYITAVMIVTVIMAVLFSQRPVLVMQVSADRNPLYVMLSNGSIRNTFTLRIQNHRYEKHRFAISVEGLPDAKMVIAGNETGAKHEVEIGPDDVEPVKVFLSLPPEGVKKLPSENAPFQFVVRDVDDGTETRYDTTFRSPEKS